MQQFTTRSAEETQALAKRLAQQLHGGEVLAFTGGLGSGKTTFCRGLAEGLGCSDAVQSPTFAIANLYRGTPPLAHFDAWRIQSGDDLETAGFYDYLDEGAVIAVEWSERVAGFLPANAIAIHIDAAPDGSRNITIKGADPF